MRDYLSYLHILLVLLIHKKTTSTEVRKCDKLELQQIMCEEPQHFDSFARRFRSRRKHNFTAQRIQIRNVTMSVIARERVSR